MAQDDLKCDTINNRDLKMKQELLKDHLHQNNLRKSVDCMLYLITMRYILVAICVTFFSTQVAFAKLWRNSYVSFELPNQWTCQVEETEWICQGQKASKKEAIIVLTAKEVGATDSLDQYLAHLKAPKKIADSSGKPLESEVKIIRKRTLTNHEWVDGQHLHSEIPQFYTRYLATTKRSIAILVTFSAHKEVFTEYAPAFLRAINSLRVIATERLLDNPGGGNMEGAGGGMMAGASVQSAFPLDMYSEEELPDEPTAKQQRMKKLLILLLSSVGAIGAYLFFTREKI